MRSLLAKLVFLLIGIGCIVLLLCKNISLSQKNLQLQADKIELTSYLDTVKSENGTLKLDRQQWIKEQGNLYKKIDSLTSIKPKTIEKIVEVQTNTVIRDSVITVDTVFVKQLDTSLVTPHYFVDLHISPPNKLSLDLGMDADILVVTYKKKVHQEGFGWWFKKRILIESNKVTTSNPYIHISDTRFIELK